MWQEEFDFLITELAQLRAKYVVYSDVIGITPAPGSQRLNCHAKGQRTDHIRQVGYREVGIGIEHIALNEALQQVPRHLDTGSVDISVSGKGAIASGEADMNNQTGALRAGRSIDMLSLVSRDLLHNVEVKLERQARANVKVNLISGGVYD